MFLRRVLLLCLLGLIPLGSPSLGSSASANGKSGASVSSALRSTDLLSAKLALDRAIDPTVDSAAIEKEVNRLADAAHRIAGPRASDGAKIDAIRKALYEEGPWNGNRPFKYDENDPYGQNIQHKLLSVYLKTRLGNSSPCRRCS